MAKLADFGESEALPVEPLERGRARVKEHYSCLTPVVAVVTDNAIKRGSQLSPGSIEATTCSQGAKAFLAVVRTFFKRWGDEPAYTGAYSPEPFLNLIDDIRRHVWLS